VDTGAVIASGGLFLAAALLLAGVLLSKTSSRFGVPSLLLFLFLGMLAGSEGVLGIEFDDAELASRVGVVALAYILFNGGLGTSWHDIRGVLAPGIALASFGVLVTAGILGLLAAAVLGIDPLEGLLLGAIIGSTDAAAVFSILRSRGVAIRQRVGSLLELESGSNDPAAVFLTIGIIALIQGDADGAFDLVVMFAQQMALGVAMGWLLARLALVLINRLRLEYDGLYPVLTIAFVLLIFEATSILGGSGFLAAYVAGLTMGNAAFLHKGSLIRFHDAIAWLAQIGMFVVFGLLVFPSQLPAVAGQGLLLAAVLVFVARPVAVFLTLAPFRLPLREVGFVSWVGLRGATPIILATFPLVEGVPDADTIFNVVFFVVLTSVLLQGTTVPAAARIFGVVSGQMRRPNRAIEAVISGDTAHSLREVVIPSSSPAVGRSIIDLGLPSGVLIVLIHRGDAVQVPQGGTIIEAADEVLLLAEEEVDFRTARLALTGQTGVG
jgi:potassium/hydrogen antiporter